MANNVGKDRSLPYGRDSQLHKRHPVLPLESAVLGHQRSGFDLSAKREV